MNTSITELNPAAFGIQNGVVRPIGLPQMLVAGGLNFGGPANVPLGRDDASYVFTDTISYARGPHIMTTPAQRPSSSAATSAATWGASTGR